MNDKATQIANLTIHIEAIQQQIDNSFWREEVKKLIKIRSDLQKRLKELLKEK